MFRVKEVSSEKIAYILDTDDDRVYVDKLPSGFYNPIIKNSPMSGYSTIFVQAKLFNEKIIPFEGGVPGRIIDSCVSYFQPKTQEIVKALGDISQIGILIHGKPGTGKTISAKIAMSRLIEGFDAICLDATNCSLDVLYHSIDSIREEGDDRLVAVFVDEFDRNMDHRELGWLTFLSGGKGSQNIVTIAVTNHIKEIPDAFKNRASRFRHIIEVDCLDAALYTQYIDQKVKGTFLETLINPSEVAYKAHEAKLTIDELKHIMSHMLINSKTFEESRDSLCYTESV